MDLVNQVFRLNDELTASIKKLKDNGVKLAEAERDYKVKLCETVLRLKDEGQTSTNINLMIYGVKEVAELRFKRDVAQTIYNMNLEYINGTKLQLRLLEAQISREWGSTNGR